jgi:hypothetical protein
VSQAVPEAASFMCDKDAGLGRTIKETVSTLKSLRAVDCVRLLWLRSSCQSSEVQAMCVLI